MPWSSPMTAKVWLLSLPRTRIGTSPAIEDAFGVDRRKRATLGGDYHGPAGFFDLIDTLAELSAGTYSFEDIAVMGAGEFSSPLMKVTATRGGAALDSFAVEVVKWRNGQVVEQWFLPFDQGTWDAFWS